MSKYVIKLEQLIASSTFGDLVLTIQYDMTGPKIVAIQGDTISADIKYSIAPMLNMFNFCLTKGIAIEEIVDQVIDQKSSGAIDQLLALIFNEVAKAPATIADIQPEDVMEINSQILKHLR